MVSNIANIVALSFSPTGWTDRAVRQLSMMLASHLELPISFDSFTLPSQRQERYYYEKTLVVFGMPTYAGRVPNKALPFLRTLFYGRNTPTVALVTYGNRSYGSALTELTQELQAQGFNVFAGGAFVVPHAFANIGFLHPDMEDLEKMQILSSAIERKIHCGNVLRPLVVNGGAPVAPYYVPCDLDGVPTNFLHAKPLTDMSACTYCGHCAKVCPMGAINPEHPEEVTGTCIKCQACVKYCPHHAKYFNDERFLAHKKMLEVNYQEQAESDIFV